MSWLNHSRLGERRLSKRTVSGITLTLLLIGMLILAFNIHLIASEEQSLLILVVVESNLHGFVQAELFQYCQDLENEGYNVQIIEYGGGTPSQLRDNVASYSPDGVLFIGDLPVAWFEIYNPLIEPNYQNFPFDYFYMDFDGTWLDNDNNGYFDEHTGNIEPEVFFGRLKTSDMGLIGDEVSIIKDYLNRNHAYRTGSMSTENKSLIYWCSDYDCNARETLPEIFEIVDIVDHPDGDEEDFKQKLQERYQLVLLGGRGHSCSQFMSMEKTGGEKLYNSEVVSVNPQSQFYVIHSCLNSRYTDPNFIAGCFAYTSKGLITIGSSKGGGGIGRGEVVYESLKAGESIGKAIKNLFENVTLVEPPERYEYYSTVLIGDPTLKIKTPIIVPAIPVGGYSFPIKAYTTTKPLTLYLALIAILTVSFTIAKRRKKQQS